MRYIITSGAMEVPIDNVRKIVNSSTGELGSMFANHCSESIENEVIYIHSISARLPMIRKNIKCELIQGTKDLLDTLKTYVIDECVVIHLMAVSDFDYGGYLEASKVKDNDYINHLKKSFDFALSGLYNHYP